MTFTGEHFVAFVFGAFVSGLSLYFWFQSNLRKKDSDLEGVQKELLLAQNQMSQLSSWTHILEGHFENLSAKVFKQQSSQFKEDQLQSLNLLLSPFKEKLKDFEKKVEDSFVTDKEDKDRLRGEISKLMELNQKITQEAHQLSRALAGDNKVMGDWGELILENILESSGLRLDAEVVLQGKDLGLKFEDGSHAKPDVVIKLPENKHLIIDSKVSLVDYLGFMKADTLESQTQFGKKHLESVRQHIQSLSQKRYEANTDIGSPEMVLMFMPIEPAFALAIKLKPEILFEAWEKNIALVSPSTLIPILRTVSSLWKSDRQNKNALDIAARGGQLYDRFVNLVLKVEEVGKRLDLAKEAQADLVGMLRDKQGNLIGQVEKLKELGAKATKSLPSI